MLKGFKDFITRGNVVDLAIAVVIGTAFAAVIAAFGKAVIQPIIAAFPGATSQGWGFSLRGGKLEKSTFIDVSLLINAIIVFLITAAVVYFVFVVPMNRLAARRKAGVEPEPEAPAEDVLLLTEIRDLLARQGGATPPSSTGTPPSTL
ncbi:large conductance mechanosensitive channel protein MscL [Angustibacter sp. Root456]|uniref:large conductance mechanosensitive channel protein MscL n=1 Tax=Angustibacter sp. Root456 TaxID=1736539 RepID=UPI0006F46DBB|nr:large conductance mechanosensitive channel protein MscL [Angustibacter sp. Root456]KQX62839.1 mechanosensitive ion channel protein MscL [Angustibacter sp. Root456]